jgi:thymidylate synthase (FAD)
MIKHGRKIMTTDQNIVKLISHTPFPLQLVAYAARVCKNSVHKSDTPAVLLMGGLQPKEAELKDLVLVGHKDRTLIEKCLIEKHESIFEHPNFTFQIHFSRAMQAQMLRHRLASYSAESSRAVDMSETTDNTQRFFIPHTIKHHTLGADIKPARVMFWECVERCMSTYRDMIQVGIPVEDARYVLPMALMQPVVMTMNIRQWRHVIAERTCKHAQFEIRYVVKEIRRMFNEIDPLFMQDAEKYDSCIHRDTCGRCLTNWEGMEENDSIKEI